MTDRSAEAYNKLKQALSEDILGRDEKLTEVAIAEKLGMSRTPVRAAIQRLLLEGLLVAEPGQGLTVPKLDHQMIVELYVLRETLEGTAARLAAQHASEVEIEAIDLLIANEKSALDQPAKLSAINRRIHGLIAFSAHNRYLLGVLSKVADTMLLLPTTLTDPKRAAAAHAEHERLAAAIASRRPADAEEAARIHMRHAQQYRLVRIVSDFNY